MKKWIPLSVVILYILLIGLGTHIPASMLQECYYYGEIHSSLISMILRVSFYAWTLPLTLAVIAVFPNVQFFAQEGAKTMFYYIYHVYFVLLAQILVKEFNFPSNIIALLGYSIVCLILCYVLQKARVLQFLVKPLSYGKNQSKNE